MDEKVLKDTKLLQCYKKLTVEDLREILQKRNFVPEIKELPNYPGLYYINLENNSAIVSDKFLDTLDKEIRETIRANSITNTIDPIAKIRLPKSGLQPKNYSKGWKYVRPNLDELSPDADCLPEAYDVVSEK